MVRQVEYDKLSGLIQNPEWRLPKDDGSSISPQPLCYGYQMNEAHKYNMYR